MHSIGEAFQAFPKIARLARECVVTEKLDGTNGQVCIVPITEGYNTGPFVAVAAGYLIYAGSRNRWLQPTKGSDNFGFAGWVKENADELVKLGPGRHYGEWWGQGIQRGYGLKEKRFSLFNVGRWLSNSHAEYAPAGAVRAPSCCSVVPVLYAGQFDTEQVRIELDSLRRYGSAAVTDFDNPEGIIVYHTAANIMFKRTLEDDEAPKSLAAAKAV